MESIFKNVSATQRMFRPLDVELGPEPGKLMAVGVGSSYPFGKEPPKEPGMET